jgi:hypothetical protein
MRHPLLLWPVALLLPLIGCHRRVDPTPAPSASAARSAAPVAPASPAVPPVGSVQEPARIASPNEQLLAAWNTALDRRDADALAALYAPRVYFYGQWKTAAQVVKLKRAAFAKQPDYRQRIDDVHITKSDRGFTAIFQKHSGPGFTSSVEGRLTLERSGGKLSIAEESDSVTDQRLLKPVPSSCAEAAFQILGEQPVIEADMRRVAREMPEAQPGGITYEEDAQHLSAAQGYFLPEHFDVRWRIEVENGVLTLSDAYTMQTFPLSTEQRARVRHACSGGAPDGGK